MKKIKSWLTIVIRILMAKHYGVPFRRRMWYNYRAMLPKESLSDKSFIEIFDKAGRYISCPSIGGEIIYNNRVQRFLYRIIGFDNESRNRDWLYDSDYIHPVAEFIGKAKED